MIIEPGSEPRRKDAEAARSLNRAQVQDHAGPSTPRQYEYGQADESSEREALLGGVPGNYPDYPDIVFPGPQEPLGPPPAFTPYEAEWFEVGHGDVVSHDGHLNTDGKSIHNVFNLVGWDRR